jgi:hypothetical protein
MATVTLFRMHHEQPTADALLKIAKALGIKGEAKESPEGLALAGDGGVLAHAAPCTRLGGVLFYADPSASLAEPAKRPVAPEAAKKWADRFLESNGLLPKPTDDGRGAEIEISAALTEAVVFDGKERKRVPAKTDVTSAITLDGIPVIGARAKVRMVFKDDDRPVFLHRGLWDALEPYEERELVRAHDAAAAVDGLLGNRKDCRDVGHSVGDVRLAYFAREFAGAPDLLAPYYFVDVEFKNVDGRAAGEVQGPRQTIWFPAYR